MIAWLVVWPLCPPLSRVVPLRITTTPLLLYLSFSLPAILAGEGCCGQAWHNFIKMSGPGRLVFFFDLFCVVGASYSPLSTASPLWLCFVFSPI